MRKMVLPAVALVALMLCLFAAPAAAAEIRLRTRGHDITRGYVTPNPKCGVDGPITVIVTVKEFHYTLWDTGHHVYQADGAVGFFDSAGNLIAHGELTTLKVGGPGDEIHAYSPYTIESNEQVQCTEKSATPGLLLLYHYGITIGEDGTIKEIHDVEKP